MKKIREILLENSISYESPGSTYPDISSFKEGIAYLYPDKLFRGFSGYNISIYGELDIYQQVEETVSRKDIFAGSDLKPGEYVVHKNHGIGVYIDTISRQVGGNKREYFLIQYGKGDRLYIPTWNADRINKYIGSKNPVITPLDSKYWDSLKKRVRRSVRELAVDLARLYAERQSVQGYAFPPDSAWQKEIEEDFPFRETADQIKAIEYVKAAMESSRPMDVLVIGDVGFGKTEVAIRAAFKAMEDGKQVLMLVPTTILADQHYMTFSRRFKEYPVVSRGHLQVQEEKRSEKNSRGLQSWEDRYAYRDSQSPSEGHHPFRPGTYYRRRGTAFWREQQGKDKTIKKTDRCPYIKRYTDSQDSLYVNGRCQGHGSY